MNREDSNSRRRENCLFSDHQRKEQFSSRRELLFSYQQRKVQFSSRRELLFFETERGCFFTSALKQGLVLCTIMTKPKTSKNGIALSVILQLMWNWARRTKVLREAFIIKEGINKYFFPSRKSFLLHLVIVKWCSPQIFFAAFECLQYVFSIPMISSFETFPSKCLTASVSMQQGHRKSDL